jgi:pyruvate formate lyase activating enzyme
VHDPLKSALYTYQQSESTIDFDGHIALLFFTQGCNFRCRYCHNPELIPLEDNNMSYDELGVILERAGDNWIDGICITGGEPTLQKAIVETAAFIKNFNMDLKIDTQGSFPRTLEKLLPHCDYVAMDYKMPMERYPSLAGVNVNPGHLRESLDLLKRGDTDYEVRATVIPGIHGEEDIMQICTELAGIKRFVLQTFTPRDNLPAEELRTTEKTPASMLEAYAAICRNHFGEVITR